VLIFGAIVHMFAAIVASNVSCDVQTAVSLDAVWCGVAVLKSSVCVCT